VIVVCNEGYASSLAAATLRDLGLDRAVDLAGGYQAWKAKLYRARSAERAVVDRPPRGPLASERW
jgi:rhodanese-related sulfurtransferase